MVRYRKCCPVHLYGPAYDTSSFLLIFRVVDRLVSRASLYVNHLPARLLLQVSFFVHCFVLFDSISIFFKRNLRPPTPSARARAVSQ